MMRKKFKSESGSILMEYAVLIMFVGAPLVILMYAGFYNFEDGIPEQVNPNSSIMVFGTEVDPRVRNENEITSPGMMTKRYFQRILTGIALPIP